MAQARLSKSMMFLYMKIGQTVEGKDLFKKVRVGFLDDKAADEAIFKVGAKLSKLVDFDVEDILKENSYTVESN